MKLFLKARLLSLPPFFSLSHTLSLCPSLFYISTHTYTHIQTAACVLQQPTSPQQKQQLTDGWALKDNRGGLRPKTASALLFNRLWITEASLTSLLKTNRVLCLAQSCRDRHTHILHFTHTEAWDCTVEKFLTTRFTFKEQWGKMFPEIQSEAEAASSSNTLIADLRSGFTLTMRVDFNELQSDRVQTRRHAVTNTPSPTRLTSTLQLMTSHRGDGLMFGQRSHTHTHTHTHSDGDHLRRSFEQLIKWKHMSRLKEKSVLCFIISLYFSWSCT